jgi:DNA end-binding protein Ku
MAASIWRGRLTFGMVSIPVRLYKAARRERIRFHHVYRPAESSEQISRTEEEDIAEPEPPRPSGKVHELPQPAPLKPAPIDTPPLERVRNLPVSEISETRVEKPQVLKAYEVEKDRYVTFAPQEVAALRPKTSSELDIAEFVRLEEIDPVFFETSYYVAPDRSGEKPYALLFQALVETGYAAIGSLAMHGREHATVIRPGRRGLILHTLFYSNEVRADEEYQGDPALVSAKELELAKLFVRALAAHYEPAKLKDKFEERLRELIESRAHTALSSYRETGPAKQAPVVDIMEALRKSLEMARKPVKSEKAEPKGSGTRQRRSRS